MSSLFRIQQDIDRSDTHQDIDDTSEEAVSEDQSDHIEIE